MAWGRGWVGDFVLSSADGKGGWRVENASLSGRVVPNIRKFPPPPPQKMNSIVIIHNDGAHL